MTGTYIFPQVMAATVETRLHGHACECETSITLANYPQTVKMEAVPEKPGEPLGRTKHLKGGYAGIWWYADHPTHYRGDARPATAKKGQRLLDAHAHALAKIVAAIKQDEMTSRLQQEFYAAGEKPL